MKIHAEHINEGEGVAACKLHADRARELLLLAPAAPDQRRWVARLARRVQRYGYRAAHHPNHDLTKLSPRYRSPVYILHVTTERYRGALTGFGYLSSDTIDSSSGQALILVKKYHK